jgi:hypothetical protein
MSVEDSIRPGEVSAASVRIENGDVNPTIVD